MTGIGSKTKEYFDNIKNKTEYLQEYMKINEKYNKAFPPPAMHWSDRKLTQCITKALATKSDPLVEYYESNRVEQDKENPLRVNRSHSNNKGKLLADLSLYRTTKRR